MSGSRANRSRVAGGRSRAATFGAKDVALRDEVRFLGQLLGETIQEQAGIRAFHLVERVRHSAIARRENKRGAAAELIKILSALSLDEKLLITRAFSHYFALTNLAERIHRVRRRREYSRPGRGPQPGSVAATLVHFRGLRARREGVVAALESMRIEPVFTAHPTEAVRPDLLNKELSIARRLVESMINSSPTPSEQADLRDRIRAEITTAWQTEEHREERPRIADEREHVLFHLGRLYHVLPRFFEELERALELCFPASPGPPAVSEALHLPDLFRFGSWVGGDMDGNPNVDAQTIRETLARHREMVLGLYRRDVWELSDRLTQSSSSAGISQPVLARWRAVESENPAWLTELTAESRNMPYRVNLGAMMRRLEATARDEAGAYTSVDEFHHEVREIEASLRDHLGGNAGLFQVRRLRQRIEVFGFHFASLDVRQDAAVHRKVLGRIWQRPDFDQDLTSEERGVLLRAALSGVDTVGVGGAPVTDDPEAARMLDVMRAIGEGRRRYGERAIGSYIISMARDANDALAVLVLARAGGLAEAGGEIPIDVAPLFETVNDLQGAAATMERLFADPIYSRHVAARGHQIIMLGYSDSSKDSGIAASRWALHQVQEQLWEVADAVGIPIVLFHGRGGTISRGGSKPRTAILAQPAGTVRGRLRFTEQGEILHAKYGMRGIALRTLELVVSAALEASWTPPGGARALPKSKRPRGAPEEIERAAVMETLAQHSRCEYRALVEHPEFIGYFRAATPIDVIERMRIGSRPASRRRQRGIEDLRAIPWVFAWTQSRHLLPGWYGVGAGLEAAVSTFGVRAVRRVVKEWLPLSTLLSDVEMVLAKADLDIARRYAELAETRERLVFPVIEAEFERTVAWVLRLQGEKELLSREPVLDRSIRLRNPYVDPMSLIQIDLLRLWRAGGRREGRLERALFSSVKGIARGLQNTG